MLVDVVRSIQEVFIQFSRRAERISQEVLTRTFVDAAPLLIQLTTKNNQVLYGRRGTGKTHALLYLSDRIRENGDHPIYLDLRTVGSNGAIYTDQQRSLPERATRLVTDVLEALETELMQIAISKIDAAPDPQQITLRLDDLSCSIRNIEVRGTTEHEITDTSSAERKGASEAKASLDPKGIRVSVGGNSSTGAANSLKEIRKTSGIPRASLDFGTFQTALSGLISVLDNPTIWLLIDEWSEIPSDLQPYLADLIRRTILPQQNGIVKIAAIEHRSNFAIKYSATDYIGLEIGADLTADVNLDDFVVYDVDQTRATDFFRNLIFKHYLASEHADAAITNASELVSTIFTQNQAFQEFVRAIEGVPRDALNLAAMMARMAYGNKISIQHVRRASREWYQQDKMSVTKSNPMLSHTLNHIITEVIENKRTRAFLFPSGLAQAQIDQLYDARLLHILKKSISSKDEPGRRYDVYKIDYGCYVDLISTTKAPLGIFDTGDGDGVDVPPDDYRSIRGAILRPEDLQELPPNRSVNAEAT